MEYLTCSGTWSIPDGSTNFNSLSCVGRNVSITSRSAENVAGDISSYIEFPANGILPALTPGEYQVLLDGSLLLLVVAFSIKMARRLILK